MDKRQKYAIASLLAFFLSLTIFIYGVLTLGIFNKNKIVVTTLQTTGPDYEVVFGQMKLKMQMPDSIKPVDAGGVMIKRNETIELNNISMNIDLCGNEYWKTMGDYFILTEKVIGAKQSDNPEYHPLIEIYSCRHISFISFWAFAILDIGLLILYRLFYKKFTRSSSN